MEYEGGSGEIVIVVEDGEGHVFSTLYSLPLLAAHLLMLAHAE